MKVRVEESQPAVVPSARQDTGGEHWRGARAREQEIIDKVVDILVLRQPCATTTSSEVMEEAERVSRA